MQKTLIGVVLFSVTLAGCGTTLVTTTPQSTPVITAIAADGNIPNTLALTGTLTAREEVDVAAKSPGRLANLTVDVGTRVTAGTVIGRLDAATESAVNRSVAANLAAVEANRDSVRKLYDARIQSAETAIEIARKSAGDTTMLTNTQLSTARDDVRRQMTSALTSAAIIAQNAADTLDRILGVSEKNRSTNDAFENYLGTLDSSAKTSAEAKLRDYLATYESFRNAFNAEILNHEPDAATLDRDTPLAITTLETAKSALEKCSTMLLKSSTGSEFSQVTLDGYKTQISTLGGSVESTLANLRNLYGSGGVTSQIAVLEKQIVKSTSDTASAITNAELTLATLKKERDAKLAEADGLIAQLRGQAGISETSLDATIIRAPGSGVVTKKYVEVGTVVNPGQPIVRIADDSALKLVVAVPDENATAFTLGRAASISVDGVAEKTFTASITKVAPQADATAKKTTVELTLARDSRLKPGLFARANFTLAGAVGVVIPAEALVSRYGQNFVYIVVDGEAVERVVTVGTRTDTSVAITNGLAAGETVIVKGQRFLREGDAVEIVGK